jgi:hypothetical protein
VGGVGRLGRPGAVRAGPPNGVVTGAASFIGVKTQ